MKRCPQCEFIYEDDQSLCDMDGALLVFDSRTLPNLHALATVDAPLAPKAHWRHRTFPAMAALILATVLSLVYFVSTQRSGYSPAQINSPAAPPQISDPVVNPAEQAAPAAEQAAPAAEQAAPAAEQALSPAASESNGATVPTKEERKPQTAKPAESPIKKDAAKSSAITTQPRTAAPSRTVEEPKKEDSKVGSILKKTGRILKKPFKF